MSGATLLDGVAEVTGDRYPNAYVPVVPNGKICAVTGLGHAKLYQILGPSGSAFRHVRTVRLCEPGATRGKLLFHVGDMLRWFDSLAATRSTIGSDLEDDDGE